MSVHASLVVPVFNEAGNVLPLLERASAVLRTLAPDHEIIVVDDGSTDGTAAELAGARERWPAVRVVTHPTNLGQARALLDGLQAAEGRLILTMDGDGQNDPADFPMLVGAVESAQLDVACGWRVDRHDSWLRRVISRVGNRVRRAVLHDPVHDAGCQLRAFRREVIDVLFPVDLLQSFLPAIAAAAGFRVGEFPVRHHSRRHGQAHFGLRQLWWRPAVAMLHIRRRLRAQSRRAPHA